MTEANRPIPTTSPNASEPFNGDLIIDIGVLGVHGAGATFDEALRDLRDAIEGHLEELDAPQTPVWMGTQIPELRRRLAEVEDLLYAAEAVAPAWGQQLVQGNSRVWVHEGFTHGHDELGDGVTRADGRPTVRPTVHKEVSREAALALTEEDVASLGLRPRVDPDGPIPRDLSLGMTKEEFDHINAYGSDS